MQPNWCVLLDPEMGRKRLSCLSWTLMFTIPNDEMNLSFFPLQNKQQMVLLVIMSELNIFNPPYNCCCAISIKYKNQELCYVNEKKQNNAIKGYYYIIQDFILFLSNQYHRFTSTELCW